MHARVPNEEAVIRFKQRINYPAIVQHIEDSEKVLMDWPRVLEKIKISSVTSKNHSKISDFFENMHVFTNVSNRFVIEEAVLLNGYNSMSDINMEYLRDGPGDFYLYSENWQKKTGDGSAICVFKNIILEIDSSEDDVNVRPVAKFLVNLMSNSLVKNNEIPGISYNILQSAQEVKAGDTFWVDIQFPSGNYPDDYDVDLLTTPIPEGLKYVKNDESKYFLKASQPGTYQFEMWVMDRRTLITNTATFEVIVKN